MAKKLKKRKKSKRRKKLSKKSYKKTRKVKKVSGKIKLKNIDNKSGEKIYKVKSEW